MKLDCSDLDRALQTPGLMADARAHAAECLKCRRELQLWAEISRIAPELHKEWDSPGLWPRIEQTLAAEAPRKRARVADWRVLAAAAAVVIVAIVLAGRWTPGKPESRDFLTDRALRDVQSAEAAYAASIARLSQLAAPELRRDSSPLAASYREKLLVLDAAIAELKSTVEQNRYSAYLRSELSSLYHEKQMTLQDWLKHAKSD